MKKKILIVVAGYYKNISSGLIKSAKNKIKNSYNIKIIHVPGIFEIPVTISKNIKKFNNCVLIFIRDPNLQSVTQTLKQYKSIDFYKKGHDKLIKNYGLGAQIIKSLKIKNMILVTRSKKKVVGLDGYGIKITKQEIIKWKKKF